MELLQRVLSPAYLLSEGDITNPLEAPGQPWFFVYREAFGFKAPVPIAGTLAASATYLTIVFLIAPLFRPVSAAAVARYKSFRVMHNIALFLFSAVCCFSTAWYLYQSGEFSDFHKLSCNHSAPKWLGLLNFAFVLSKIWEWIDTVLLVWGAPDFRKLGVLHIYHHSTTLWLMLHVTNVPGTVKMGMLLNGGVHTLMYAHYARPFPKAVVPLITIAQLAQLFWLTYQWHVTPATCGGRYQVLADEYPWDFATPYAFVPVYIIFFLRFFVERWILGKTHQKPKKA